MKIMYDSMFIDIYIMYMYIVVIICNKIINYICLLIKKNKIKIFKDVRF